MSSMKDYVVGSGNIFADVKVPRPEEGERSLIIDRPTIFEIAPEFVRTPGAPRRTSRETD
jgi:hypothetical protein